jgi:N-acyl-D-amino-acid deacylase
MHSHSDLAYLWEQTPDQKIRQGVTTELLSQDGLGVAPVSAENVDLWATLIAGLQGRIPPEKWTWRTFEQYLQALEERRLPNNVAVLISHGPVRLMAMGMDDRAPTHSETAKMQKLVHEAMGMGAFGLSTGLVYPPNSYSTTAELVALNREVAAQGGVFVVHQRDEGRLLPAAFDEVLTVAERAGVHLHVSHLKAYGRAHWGLMDGILAQAEAFADRGLGLSWDRYPYLAGCTMLSAVLPSWTFARGTAALIRNLSNPRFRQRVREAFGLGLEVWNNRALSIGWDNVTVSGVTREENRWMEGQSCAVLASKRGQDPVDFVCDLLLEEELAVTMIAHYGSEEVMAKVLCHPSATVGSDAIFLGTPHPRLYGAFPRYLQRFVREKKRMTLAEAVRKITSAPARILGLRERGLLREGFWADIVLLDPETIADRATYQDPRQYPAGIPYVFVNGQPVVENGQYTGSLPGQVLRKGAG